MRIELKRAYPSVWTGDAASFGGSQNWFPDRNFQLCGCGTIACADTLLYLRGQEGLSREEYLHYVNSLRRRFPLVPGRGIDGVRLAMGMNACLRAAKLPCRARWGISGRRFWDRLSGMLTEDLPVIVSIGPNFPRLWGTERVTLCRRGEDGAFVPAERTKAHFLTVTALDDDWMEVSSWGQRLYIDRGEYGRYMRAQGAPLTNLLYLERK